MVNILIWIFLEILGNSKNPISLIEFGALFGPFVSNGDYWRFFSSIFIHIGIIHLLFNQIAILIFIRLNESIYGNLKLLIIYIFSGLFANLLSYYLTPFNISAGSSGAIFGIAGSYLAFLLYQKPKEPIEKRENLIGISIIILINLLYGITDTRIDNWAHIGGLISGFIMGLLMLKIFNYQTNLFIKMSLLIIIILTLLLNIHLRSYYLKHNISTYIFSAEIYIKTSNKEKALYELISAKEIAYKNHDQNSLNKINNLIQSINK